MNFMVRGGTMLRGGGSVGGILLLCLSDAAFTASPWALYTSSKGRSGKVFFLFRSERDISQTFAIRQNSFRNREGSPCMQKMEGKMDRLELDKY